MATARKSLRGIKTMAALVDRRRSRTAAGALLEMSALANEKERLNQELAVALRRHDEIRGRLAEIAAKEQRLQAFIKNPTLVATALSPAVEERPRRVKTRELRY